MNNSGTTDKGKVITFYSFKGGVGRSMALVNVATLLSSWGKKVLMVDWDLEAPGLEKFFNGATEGLDTSKQEGLLELLQALQTNETVDWQQYIFSFSTKLSKTPLDLIIAGRNHDQYTEELRNFNVANFYEAQKGAYRLENLRNEWLDTYDYVLIDSRTGVTDFGGICTIHMPDILVMLLTPTEQGLRGTLRIAERADHARQSLPFDREKLLVFPLPSRIDGTTEFEKSRQWIRRFAESFEPLFDNWLPADIAPEDFLQRVKIPYIPYFSYGETLPVIEQGMNDPAGLGYAYENIAMLLAQGLDRVDVFWGDREEYLERVSGKVIIKIPNVKKSHINVYVLQGTQEDIYYKNLLTDALNIVSDKYEVNVVNQDIKVLGLSKVQILKGLIKTIDIVIVLYTQYYDHCLSDPESVEFAEYYVIEKSKIIFILPIFDSLQIINPPKFLRERIGLNFHELSNPLDLAKNLEFTFDVIQTYREISRKKISSKL
ncbi:MAG: ParA family protein [Chitinophagales bacterium]|nr:ParA family protein [Chitinophagales bacterium]